MQTNFIEIGLSFAIPLLLFAMQFGGKCLIRINQGRQSDDGVVGAELGITGIGLLAAVVILMISYPDLVSVFRAGGSLVGLAPQIMVGSVLLQGVFWVFACTNTMRLLNVQLGNKQDIRKYTRRANGLGIASIGVVIILIIVR